MNSAGYLRFGKRMLDLLIAVPIVVLLLPIYAALWAAVKLTSNGPALFIQRRVGLNGELFNFYKFRSMYVDRPIASMDAQARELSKQGILLKVDNDPRITPVGRILRKTSLDELPQFFNVIKGDMSLVGPRPLIEFMFSGKDHERRVRSVVPPGITGYWQVYARGESSSLQQMINYDLRYLQEASLSTDLKLLAKTLPAVIKGSGAL